MSRVKVFNPESMESIAQFAELHLSQLERIASGVNATEQQEQFHRDINSVILDGNGNGQIEFDGRIGYDRICERISTCVTGATIGSVGIFFAAVSPMNLVEFIGAAQIATTINGIGQCVCYSDAFNNSLHLVTADKVLVQFSGYAAGAIASVNVQQKYLKQYEHTHNLQRAHLGDA